jgi:hypothetical protein
MHLSVLYKEFSILHLLFLSALSFYKGSIGPGYYGTDELEWTGIVGMDMDMDMIQKWTNYIYPS